MQAEVQDKRYDNRNDSCFLVEYAGSTASADNFYKGVTLNFSQTGMCLLVFNSLNAGEKIIIRNDIRKITQATICWTKKLDDNIYKLGLFFN